MRFRLLVIINSVVTLWLGLILLSSLPKGVAYPLTFLLCASTGLAITLFPSLASRRGFLVAIFMLAFTLRCSVAIFQYQNSISRGDKGFATMHDDVFWFELGNIVLENAKSGENLLHLLRDGIDYDTITEYQQAGHQSQMGWPFFLALFLASGADLFTLNLLNCLIGSLLVVVVYQFACLVLDEQTAKVAAVVVCLSSGIVYSALLLRDNLIALLFSLSICLAVRIDHRALGKIGLLLGLTGLITTFRGFAGILLVFSVMVFWTYRQKSRKSFYFLLMFSAATICLLSLNPEAMSKIPFLNFAEGETLSQRIEAGVTVIQELRSDVDQSVFGSMIIRASASPILYYTFGMILTFGVSVVRPPLIPHVDEWFQFPVAIVWCGVFLPYFVVGLYKILFSTRRLELLGSCALAYFFCGLIIAGSSTSAAGRYLHSLVIFEATIVAFGYQSLRRWTYLQFLWVCLVSCFAIIRLLL